MGPQSRQNLAAEVPTQVEFKWFFGKLAGRAWQGLLIASKIGVLNSVKDAPASKEFS
jgi:hypothetical protein